MGSLGTGELIVIAIAALVVFGPKRLPELARRAGELLAKARTATRSLTESLDGDYEELAAPLQTLKSEYDATVKEIKNIGTTVTGLGTTLPGEEVDSAEAVDGRGSTVDGREEEEEADSREAVDGRGSTVDGAEEEEEADSREAVDGKGSTVDGREEEEEEEAHSSQPTADSSEEEETGDSGTVDRRPSTVDSPAPTEDRESS